MTLDVDSYFAKTPTNLNKLKVVACGLQAVILGPHFPVSDMYRMVDDD